MFDSLTRGWGYYGILSSGYFYLVVGESRVRVYAHAKRNIPKPKKSPAIPRETAGCSTRHTGAPEKVLYDTMHTQESQARKRKKADGANPRQP